MTNSSDNSFQEKRRQAGNLLLWLGGLMSVLVIADRSGFASSVFPGFWYRSRSIHLLICAGLFVAAVLIYRRPEAAESDDVESTPEPDTSPPPDVSSAGPLFESVRLFTRADCPLCDEAVEVLRQYRSVMPEIQSVDIAQDPLLEEQHGHWIPVVEIDGRVRFRGKVDPVLLQRLVDARRRGLPDVDNEVSA